MGMAAGDPADGGHMVEAVQDLMADFILGDQLATRNAEAGAARGDDRSADGDPSA
jgi:hypothetical protein